MKKLFSSLLAASAALSVWAAGDAATITSVPSPAVATKPVTITITTTDLGSEVYVYSWVVVNGTSKWAAAWDYTNVPQYQMNGSNGVYTYTVDDIKSFYRLTDEELAKVNALNFIAKTKGGKQTQDLNIELIQAPLQEYSGGSGSASDPWLISSTDDLKTLSKNSAHWGEGCYFLLSENVAATGVTTPIGNSAAPFKGNLDGNGHCVSGLTLSGTTVGEGVGLFGVVDGANISNLGVVDANVTGATFTGILAGRMLNGSISLCYTTGKVNASSICAGGLVGENDATISDCYSVASVTSSSYAAGGLVGKNVGNIYNTIACGAVEGYDYVGGLVGANYGTVNGCVSVNEKISVSATNNYAARFGGNDNSRNNSIGNYAWESIPVGHQSWSAYGDHATVKHANDLVVESSFRHLTGWDFDSNWKWMASHTRSTLSQQGPVLQVHGDNQPMIYPQEFFNTVSGVESLTGDASGITVGPNPTDGIVRVCSSSSILSCVAYGLNGSVVCVADPAGDTETIIDLGNCQSGVYVVQVSVDGEVPATFKIIKK